MGSKKWKILPFATTLCLHFNFISSSKRSGTGGYLLRQWRQWRRRHFDALSSHRRYCRFIFLDPATLSHTEQCPKSIENFLQRVTRKFIAPFDKTIQKYCRIKCIRHSNGTYSYKYNFYTYIHLSECMRLSISISLY